MKFEAWKMLGTLRKRQGSEYGKLVQKLLALSLLEAGADRLTERAVQGIDIEVELRGRKLALEVKTTEGSSISVGKKDLNGLKARREEGFETLIGVLGGRRTDEWMFVPIPGTDLQANAQTDIVFLRPFADKDLEHFIEEPFITSMDRYGILACDGGQSALNEVLQRHQNYAQA